MEHKKCFGEYGISEMCQGCNDEEFCYQSTTGDMAFLCMGSGVFECGFDAIQERLFKLFTSKQWRERAIIIMRLQGMTNIDIALNLHICERSVFLKLKKIRKKYPEIGYAMSCMCKNSPLKKRRIYER